MTLAAVVATKESQLVLILDDDLMVTEALAGGLEREGRTIVTCNDLEFAELMVERLKPSHVVSDIRLSGPFGFEGLDFIRFVRQHSPATRVILMTGDAPDALQLEASERGAVGFLRKPFDIADLDQALDLLSCSAFSSRSSADASIIRMPLLDEIIAGDSLKAFFQPILLLPDGVEPIGFESLARYQGNSLLRNPEVLFQYAKRKQRVEDLEMACISSTLRAGARLAARGSLFLNIHPQALSGSRIRDVLIRDCEQNQISLDRIVLEITEQESLRAGPQLFANVEHLRAVGVRFAFDDMGVAYSHLPFIDRLRPSFLKISHEFGTDFETDSTKLKIIMNLQSLARDFECDLILEGIETHETAEMAARLGIKFGQGFLFGRPADPSTFA
ncbi:MAG TPA: EAL domain-containing response regulator [Thermoanaerobaculia bacterium]|nr:EAL domain-containing response regulator [Thermoanaerobaculia bacterium]